MNQLYIFILKTLRKTYAKISATSVLSVPQCEQNADKASKIIYDKLMGDEPCMIARFGSTELTTMVNFLGVKKRDKDILGFIRGKKLQWWWNKKTLHQMQQNAGFFPSSPEKIETFCNLMIQDIRQVDVLGSWLGIETYFDNELLKCRKIRLELLNPYFSILPWTRALTGKKVLVIHPFAEQIEAQYQKRELLFDNPDILPKFELSTIAAVQSIGGETNGFNNWFSALNWMKAEMDKHDYDICLIGAGAYGFPLAAHAKRSGKKAVHLGGALQLLFGIKGKRWEDPNYNKDYNYAALMNEYWEKPKDKLRPRSANQVEGGCYW